MVFCEESASWYSKIEFEILFCLFCCSFSTMNYRLGCLLLKFRKLKLVVDASLITGFGL